MRFTLSLPRDYVAWSRSIFSSLIVWYIYTIGKPLLQGLFV